MADTFSNGVTSVVPVLRPKGPGWREVHMPRSPYTMGYPCRAFIHDESMLAVMSAVEVMADEKNGPEYHISISKQTNPTSRCDSNEAKWVIQQFDCEHGWDEDNHVPSGIARNFWKIVAGSLTGNVCRCKESEPAIREDKGDFIWRPAPERHP